MCGTADWEWKDNPDAYQADRSFCQGCYRKDAASDVGEGQSLPAGTSVVLIPTGTPQWQAALDAQEAAYIAEREARRAARQQGDDW